jgi:hypothetical protein
MSKLPFLDITEKHTIAELKTAIKDLIPDIRDGHSTNNLVIDSAKVNLYQNEIFRMMLNETINILDKSIKDTAKFSRWMIFISTVMIIVSVILKFI